MEDINREVSIEQIDFNVDIEDVNYTIEINPPSKYVVELNEQGPQGARGNGIVSITKTSTVGLVDIYTVLYDNGTTSTFQITNGANGYTFEQGIASDTWIIEHNMGKRPSVTIVDSAGNMQMPNEISYDSDTQITVTFLSAFAGKAYLN